MSILSDIWDGVRTTLVGLKITVPYIWKKPVTGMYPHERLDLPERVRNRLYVNMDDCIGCDQCSRACPVNCITIETAKAVDGDSPGVTSNGKKKALWVTRFDIDIAKCCYCGLCTFPCPTECIKMTDVFEFAEQERNNLIYNYITLTPEEVQEKVAMEKAGDAAVLARKTAAKGGAPAPAAAPAAAAPAPAAAAPASAGQKLHVPPGTDPEKAAKIAELQARMAAAAAKRQAESAASKPAAAVVAEAAPEAAAAPVQAAPAAASAEDDPGKEARIAAWKEKIAALKRERGES
ncbi:MAG: dehydrogenase subunit [Chlorobi bacterium]|nr:dehydrogenase subunit [Chlorobiota bacterium]